MQAQPNTFAQHVAAAWRAGLSMAAYAKKHGLAASTLYHWQKKLRLTQSSSMDAATPPSITLSPGCQEQAKPMASDKFMVVRLGSTEPKSPTQSTLTAQRAQTAPESTTTPVPPVCVDQHHLPSNCTPILPGGIRLQMSELAPPTWLAALSHGAQGAR